MERLRLPNVKWFDVLKLKWRHDAVTTRKVMMKVAMPSAGVKMAI